MSLPGAIIFFTGVASCILVLSNSYKKSVNLTWSLFGLTSAFWGFGEFFLFNATDAVSALFWGRFINCLPLLHPIFFFHFVCAFEEKVKEKKKELFLYYTISLLLFVLVIVYPSANISGVRQMFGTFYYPMPGIIFHFIGVFFTYLVTYGLILLHKEHKTANSIKANQTNYLFWGFLTTFLPGAGMAFLPVYNISIPPIGIYLIPAYIFTTTYAIIKHHLMDITIVIKTYGLFVLIYFLLLITLLLFGIVGREWLMTIFPHYWWLGLMLSTMVIAIAGHIVANYFKRRSELEITTEMEVRSNKERLILLGQLIGGIAHNMKTPIMAMGGWVAHERELITEYEESLGDKSITEDDYREIAKEMREGCTKVMTQLQYMTEVIDTIRGQAMELQDTSRSVFDIRDLVKRVDLLLESELRRNKCFLRKEVEIDEKTVIAGEVSNLVQVLANLINNAMHAYRAKGGEIIFRITKDEKDILIMLQDFGVGIPERVQKDLFQTMVTTKGKFGTGLGLLMSKSTIKARFDGNITFTSKEGEGSTFCIHIPLTKIVPLPA